MRKSSLLYFLLFLGWAAHSQELPDALDRFQLLTTDNQLPKNLTSSRSAVFISVPDKNGRIPEAGNWKEVARQVHAGLIKTGLDPVAYFNLNHVMAGIDATDGFLNPLRIRNIENIIFVVQRNGLLGAEVELIITPRNTEGELLKLNQSVYRVTRNAVGELIAQLGRDVYQAQLINSNFMVMDGPEFFEDTQVVKGRRYESFNSDLKISKLAVPMFAKFQFPAGVDSTTVDQGKLAVINTYNQQVEQANQELAQLMAAYPFKYELVDYSVGEDHLYRKEFSYVLQFLHASGQEIKRLLNYQTDPSETDYLSLKAIAPGVTTLEKFPVKTPVFKFYMKQLVNKEVYLGKQWEADLTWQEALTNHLTNFSEVLQANKK